MGSRGRVTLSFGTFPLVSGFILNRSGLSAAGHSFAMVLLVPCPQRVQPLPKPGFFRPSPVLIAVCVGIRFFHGLGQKPPSNQHATANRRFSQHLESFGWSLGQNCHFASKIERRWQLLRFPDTRTWLSVDSAVGLTVFFEPGVRLPSQGHRALESHRLFWVLGDLLPSSSQHPSSHRCSRTALRPRPIGFAAEGSHLAPCVNRQLRNPGLKRRERYEVTSHQFLLISLKMKKVLPSSCSISQ